MRYTLAPEQERVICEIAEPLAPALKNSFLLRVSATLERSRRPGGFVTDDIVASAINAVLRELKIVG